MSINWTKLAGESHAERVQTLRCAGYSFADGLPSANGAGYFPARKGGGYLKTCVPVRHAYLLEPGCPASHATVAYLPL